METEQIDKLFLELSQFTKAKTKKELELEAKVESLKIALKNEQTLDRRKSKA